MERSTHRYCNPEPDDKVRRLDAYEMFPLLHENKTTLSR